MKDYYGDGAFNSSNPDVPDSLEVGKKADIFSSFSFNFLDIMLVMFGHFQLLKSSNFM